MNNLLEQFQKLPVAQKLGGLLVLIVGLSAANYFLLVQPIEDNIVRLAKKQSDLDTEYTQKKTIANNLNSYKQKLEKLEQDLALALTELPAEAQMDELLRQINDVGKKAGLSISQVQPGVESQGSQPFIAQIPIGMAVSGSYEEIAVFFESVSKLRRIVNISNINLGAPTTRNEKVVLTASFAATTFRFKSVDAKAKAKKPGQK